MVKFIFSNLGRGMLYTIGKIIGFGVIGFIIYYLVTHFEIDQQTIHSIVRGLLV